ncbi:MAG: tetratricopeptide repeat protein, partial [Rhodomicrobium sp.]
MAMFSVRRGLLAIAVAYLLVGAGPDAQAQQGGGAAAAGAFFDMMARLRGQGGYSPAGPYSPEPLGQGPGTQGLLMQAGFFGGGSEAENPQAMWQQEQRDLKEGRLREAIALAERLLVIVRSRLGENNPDTYRMLGNLAMLYSTVSRFSEAETMHARAIHGLEMTLGANHPNTRLELGNLAWLYLEMGRYREAEATYKRALAGAESMTAAKDEFTLRSYFGLGTVYARQGRYREAEDLTKQALLSSERALGKEHVATIDAVNALQMVYEYEGRFDESQALLLRALAASERVRGKNHPGTILLVYNLSRHYFEEGKYDLAEPPAKRALAAIGRILGKDDFRYVMSLENLALLYVNTGRLKEAEPLHLQALEIAERVIGKDTYLTLSIVNQLAENYMQQGRFAEADTLFQRVRLSETARMVGMEHPGAIDNLGDLGELNFAQGNNRQAVEYWRRSTSAAIQRTERRADDTGQALTGKSRSETQRVSRQFQGLVKAAYRLTSEGKAPDAALAGEMFQTAQWAIRSEAAQSLAQMAARGAAGNQALANLVRDRQDLMTKWLAHDKQRNEALSQPPAQRNSQGEAENQAALTALRKRIADIDRRLAEEFPDYSSLVNPMPLTVEEVQAQLGPDEALVFFFDTQELKPAPEETFVWAITRNEARWVRAGLGTAAIAREVQALRCGLDAAAWRTADCAGLTGQNYDPSNEQGIFALPFDHARAHRLYKTLFGQVEDIVKGKQLQIVPSGAL